MSDEEFSEETLGFSKSFIIFAAESRFKPILSASSGLVRRLLIRLRTLSFLSIRIAFPTLGVSGACDVLEFHRSGVGIPLKGRDGLWQPYPVEYKRGKPKQDTTDALQLCGQAVCLEEMLCCQIPTGALYYGETHRRTEVEFTPELRQEVRTLLEEMHALYERGWTPKVKPTKACSACSLKELCLPKLMRKQSVADYLRDHLEETP